MTRGRAWHLATAGLTTAAVILQLVLVWQGHNVLDEKDPPSLGERLIRFFGYFAVLANILIAWVAFGPRGRVQGRDVLAGLVFPIAWLVYTFVRGAIAGFYPYPFLNADVEGYAAVAVACVGIAALFVGLAALAWKGDGLLTRTRWRD